MVDSRETSSRTGGAIVMLVGLVLIADKIHLPFLNNVSLWQLWPLALIAFGFMTLWGALEGKSVAGVAGSASTRWHWAASGDSRQLQHVLHVRRQQPEGERRLQGRRPDVAIFGGGGLDLRNATMSADEAVVNVNAIFGGFEIRVPETWLVDVHVAGIFGGHEDKTHQPDTRLVPNPKRLIVRGSTIFGGLGLKN